MRLSAERLDEIRAGLAAEGKPDPAITPAELSSMADELWQLRLRVSSASRSAVLKTPATGH